MTRLAILTSTAFWNRTRGSERRISELVLALLDAGHDVAAIWAGRARPEDRAALDALTAARCTLEETGVYLPEVPRNAPIDAYASPPLTGALARVLARLRPDALIAEYVRFAPVVAALPPHARPALTLLDTHDVMHLRARRFAEVGHDHWTAPTRQEESRALAAFDRVIAINDADARVLASMTGPERVVVVPHAADAAASPEPDGPPTALFLGAPGLPNADAARWLITEIWPPARQRLPAGARLIVAGRVRDRLTDLHATDPTVELPGFVDDLPALYARCHAVISPLRFGGGLKIKNVEALAHGRALVTTPVGAEGIEAHAGSAFLVANDAPSLADHLVTVLTDGPRRHALAAGALACARAVFSRDAAYAPLLALLRSPTRSLAG